jgi:hypothetical protein
MATFRVKYFNDGKEEILTVKSFDTQSAGKEFALLYPHIPASNILEVKKVNENNLEDYLKNLFLGNLGLPMTYWVYGVLGGIVWAVSVLALKPDPDGDLITYLWIGFAIYYFVVYVGIWNAATKYEGSKVWAILAKFVIVIAVLPTALHLLKRLAE